jgi:hypothetical protein
MIEDSTEYLIASLRHRWNTLTPQETLAIAVAVEQQRRTAMAETEEIRQHLAAAAKHLNTILNLADDGRADLCGETAQRALEALAGVAS